MTTAAAEITNHIQSRAWGPRGLLLFGGPEDQGLGDIFVGARHYNCLRDAFPGLQMMVHTTQAEQWLAACGPEIRCIPAVSRELIVASVDVIVFDSVELSSIQSWIEESSAVIFDIPPLGNSFRYKYPKTPWRKVALPPPTNRPRRIWEVYESLGFPVSGRKPARPRDSGEGMIFLNPYASFGLKCMCASFLSELLDVLPETCRSTTISCPTIPPHPPEDRSTFEQLQNILVAAQRKVVALRPLGTREYIEAVRNAKVAIGPDTSTQHIAAVYGTPSLACYVPEARDRYTFFGSLGPENICVRIPSRKASPQVRRLAELVSTLASILLERNLGELPPRTYQADLHDQESFVDTCRQIALRELNVEEGKSVLENVTQRVRQSIPAKWRQFLMPELTRILRGICERATAETDVPDLLGLAELRDINALNLLRLLIGRKAD